MSNWTNTTHRLTNGEFNRLERAANLASSLSSQVTSLNAALRRSEDALNSRLNDAEREARDTRAALQEANAENAARHEALRSQLQNAIAATDAHIDAARRETIQAMDDMREEFNTNLVNAIESNNRNIESAMNRNNNILNGRIDALRIATNNAIDSVRADIDNIVAADNDLLGQAQEYREQTRVLQGMIGATRHQILIPGGYQSVLDAVNQAEADLSLAEVNHANSPVARNNARIAFEEAIRFYEEIRIAENEWQMQLSTAEQLAEIVATQLENSRIIEPKPGKEFDVDYWTYGDLSSHNETLEGLREQLDKPDELTRDDIVNIQSALRNVSENVENTHRDAYIAVVTSQSVADEAEKLRAELAAQGSFTVEDHAYEGNDSRGNYRYILRNPSGLTVVVTVSINREDGVSIETVADIIDYGNMAMENAERLVTRVVESLSGKTPDTWHRESTQCHDRGGIVCHPERADMNAWKHGSREGKPATATDANARSTRATSK